MSKTLRAIGEDLDALHDLLMEVGGEVTEEEAERAIDSWLAENEQQLKDKLTGYATLIKAAENRAAEKKAEIDRVKALMQTDLNLVAKLKERLIYFFSAKGIQRVQARYHTITLGKSGGVLPLEITPGAKPDPTYGKFVKVTFDWDKDEIRRALEAGEDVPFARLGERGNSIRIR